MSIAITPIEGKLTTLFYEERVQRVWIMKIKGRGKRLLKAITS